MRFRLHIRYALAIAALFILPACGQKPVNTIADVGARLAPVIEEAQKVVSTAEAAGTLPKEAVARAQALFIQTGQVAQKLATGIRAYDALTGDAERTGQAAQIRTLLDELRRLTRAVMAATGTNGPLSDQLNRSFTNLDRLIDVIVNGLAPLPAGGI